MADRADQYGGQILNQGVKFTAAWEQSCIDEADGGVAIHGPLTDRPGLKLRITYQSSPEQNPFIPVDENSRCWRSRQQHVASPAEFFAGWCINL